MTDDQLRDLVRDAVARHLGQGHVRHDHVPGAVAGHGLTLHAADAIAGPGPGPAVSALSVVVRQHPSHYRYGLASGDDADGPCLIEPSVRCNHCGYCQSHGH